MESTEESYTDSNALIKRIRLLQADHAPDGWPAIQMKDITSLCDSIFQLEQKLIGWPDLFDENMIMQSQLESVTGEIKRLLLINYDLNAELEQYRSIAETVGASKAVSELEQATARIQELEAQLCESREWADQDEIHIERLEQEFEDYRAMPLSTVVKQLQAQNAKLVEALGKWEVAWQAWHDKYADGRGFEDTRACYDLAAALKEMEVGNADNH